jgi:hypothetical protein
MNFPQIYKKPRAKQRIEIMVDYEMDPDGWFLKFVYIENSTNKIAHEHCVIESDIPNWVSSITRDGWILQK